MEEMACPQCDEDVYVDFPFGDDVKCTKCGCVFETDFEYVTEDSLACWATGVIVKDGEK